MPTTIRLGLRRNNAGGLERSSEKCGGGAREALYQLSCAISVTKVIEVAALLTDPVSIADHGVIDQAMRAAVEMLDSANDRLDAAVIRSPSGVVAASCG